MCAEQQKEDAEHQSVQPAGQPYRVACFRDGIFQDTAAGNGSQQDHCKPQMPVQILQIMQVVQGIHIHGNMPGPDVGKTDRDQAPPLSSPDSLTVIAAKPDSPVQLLAALS